MSNCVRKPKTSRWGFPLAILFFVVAGAFVIGTSQMARSQSTNADVEALIDDCCTQAENSLHDGEGTLQSCLAHGMKDLIKDGKATKAERKDVLTSAAQLTVDEFCNGGGDSRDLTVGGDDGGETRDLTVGGETTGGDDGGETRDLTVGGETTGGDDGGTTRDLTVGE